VGSRGFSTALFFFFTKRRKATGGKEEKLPTSFGKNQRFFPRMLGKCLWHFPSHAVGLGSCEATAVLFSFSPTFFFSLLEKRKRLIRTPAYGSEGHQAIHYLMSPSERSEFGRMIAGKSFSCVS